MLTSFEKCSRAPPRLTIVGSQRHAGHRFARARRESCRGANDEPWHKLTDRLRASQAPDQWIERVGGVFQGLDTAGQKVPPPAVVGAGLLVFEHCDLITKSPKDHHETLVRVRHLSSPR